MEKNLPIFNPSSSTSSVFKPSNKIKSEINALEYALSTKSSYIASDPNLCKTMQERYPSLGLKEVKIPEAFLNCLMHICKSSKARSHYFSMNGFAITIAESGREDLNTIFRTGSKFNFNHISSLYRTYHETLIKKDYFPDPKIYKSENIIDARNFFRLVFTTNKECAELSKALQEYTSNSRMFAHLPCFNEGVLIISETTRCHWKVTSIDIAENAVSMEMYFYDEDNEMFVPFILFQMTIKFPETDTNEIKITHMQYYSLRDIFHCISPKQMKWNTIDRKAWNSVIVKFAKMVDESSENIDCVHEAINENYPIILWCFAYVNYILHMNKKNHKPRHKRTEKVKSEKSFDPEKQKEKKLHILSEYISITSDEPPQEMTRKTVVKYHLASWTVKGHMRHCKSGKVVYVRPHIKKRKGMEEEAKTVEPRKQIVKV